MTIVSIVDFEQVNVSWVDVWQGFETPLKVSQPTLHINALSANPPKMVKHTQTSWWQVGGTQIRRQVGVFDKV